VPEKRAFPFEEDEQGKMKAVIQTIDWFNWLGEDEEVEYEEEEEE
jgi:hypothetical protein